MKSSDIYIRAVSQEMPQLPITEIRLKITYLKFRSNFPGANESTHGYVITSICSMGCQYKSNCSLWHLSKVNKTQQQTLTLNKILHGTSIQRQDKIWYRMHQIYCTLIWQTVSIIQLIHEFFYLHMIHSCACIHARTHPCMHAHTHS